MKVAYVAFILFLVQTLHFSNNAIITFQGETIATVNRSEFISLLGSSVIDDEKVTRLMEKLNKQIEKQPENASIDDYGAIVKEKLGYKLDEKGFKEAFFRYYFSAAPATISIPVTPLFPKVDSELLANIRVKQIGQYATYFNHRKKGRATNIALAANAINNHVVFPGETFSFNEVVGKRTMEKGYLPAPVIIRGKIYRDFGGGICQVSSTLFNAVDRAGVQILQRYSHSKRVPYVPKGRDAQVSWYGADFTFKNTYNQPILIRAKVYGGTLVITIHSSEVIELHKGNSLLDLF